MLPERRPSLPPALGLAASPAAVLSAAGGPCWWGRPASRQQDPSVAVAISDTQRAPPVRSPVSSGFRLVVRPVVHARLARVADRVTSAAPCQRKRSRGPGL